MLSDEFNNQDTTVDEVIKRCVKITTQYNPETTVLSFYGPGDEVLHIDDNRSLFLYSKQPDETVLWDIFVDHLRHMYPSLPSILTDGNLTFNVTRFSGENK